MFKFHRFTVCNILAGLVLFCVHQLGFAKESTQLMTVNPTTGVMPGTVYNSVNPDVSPDGRYVVFESDAVNLLPSAANGYRQIYLHDRVRGVLELVSTADDGTAGNKESYRPVVSSDGCLVAFYSLATNLVANDSNGVYDVFVRDRCQGSGQTKLVSVSSAGVQGNARSSDPDISADGRWLVFESDAANFVPDDLRGVSQIFLRDLSSNTTTRISTPQNGVGDGGGGHHPKISADGSRIAFWSYSSQLVSNDINGLWDIFLYDRGSAAMSLVSTDSNGNQHNQGDDSASRIVEPEISDNGRYVSFATTASNLVAGDTNGKQDVFVKDTQSGTTVRASVTSSGGESDGDSPIGQGERAALSGDGNWVLFSTNAPNLTADGKGPRVILHNILTGTNKAIAPWSGFSSSRPAISGLNAAADKSTSYGRFIAFFEGAHLDARHDGGGIYLYDRHREPVADAGDAQTTTVGQTVALDGTGSYVADNDFPSPTPALSYTWTQITGPSVSLNSPHLAAPSFVPSTSGLHEFRLVVNDTIEDSSPSTVSIQVNSASPIVANAGSSRSASIGDTVKLTGSATATSNSIAVNKLKYTWRQVSGPQVWSGKAKTGKVNSFVPKASGTYVFSLVASNKQFASEASTVSISVNAAINVTSPGNGSVWTAKKNETVSWDYSGINKSQKLRISVSTDGGQHFTTLTSAASVSKKSYKVKIKSKTSNALVKVCLLAGKTELACGASAGGFVVQ